MQWEYKSTAIPFDKDHTQVVEKLNALGVEHWEAVNLQYDMFANGVRGDKIGRARVLLKRPVVSGDADYEV